MDPARAAGAPRLGVLGGTFDPIHFGHLAIARAARRRLDLDEVLLVPSSRPPHKADTGAPAADRLAMVELAVRDEDGLRACDIEVRRGGTSYTVDTLEEIRRRRPGAEIYFIIGADSIVELPRWRDSARILELAQIVTLPRDGGAGGFSPAAFPGVPAATLERCERHRLEMPPVHVASRQVRAEAAAGRPLDALVPAAVAEHIRKRRLYGWPGAAAV